MENSKAQEMIYADKIKGEIQINIFRIVFLIIAFILLVLLILNIQTVSITYKIDTILIFVGILYSILFINLLKKKKYYMFLTYFSSFFDISLTTFSILMGIHAYKSSYATLPIGFNVFILFAIITSTIRRHNYKNTLFTTILAVTSYLITVIIMYKHGVFSPIFYTEDKTLIVRFDLTNELSKAFIILIVGLICTYISYNFDITFNRGIEFEIKKEKFSTANRVTSSIIHDIKNSLNIISGYSEIIGMRIPDSKRYIIKINNEIFNLSNSLQEILEYTKNENEINFNTKKISLLNFIDEIQDIVNSMKTIYKNLNIQIEDYTEEKNIILNIDLFKIKRAILNILKNSIEACSSKNNPLIIIKINKRIGKTKKNIQNGYLIITIIDNGMGIEEDDKDIIFTPFYTKNKKNGTGLGLAITKSIIDAHHGHIYYKSEKNKGTAFTIELPCIIDS